MAVAGLDSGEVAAVESALETATEWVVSPDQMAALTDRVVAAPMRPRGRLATPGARA